MTTVTKVGTFTSTEVHRVVYMPNYASLSRETKSVQCIILYHAITLRFCVLWTDARQKLRNGPLDKCVVLRTEEIGPLKPEI